MFNTFLTLPYCILIISLLFLSGCGCSENKTTGGNDPDEVDGPPVMIVIHADEAPAELEMSRAENWLNLQAIVDRADSGEHELTILFAPFWADYFIDNNEDALNIVVEWSNEGHLLGFHHHDCTHSYPDFYCNGDTCDADGMCQGQESYGTVAQALQAFNDIDGFPMLTVGNHGRSTDFRSDEWQEQIAYGTDNNRSDTSEHKVEDYIFIGKSACAEYGSLKVPEISHRQLAVGSFIDEGGESLEVLGAELEIFAEAENDELNLGVVFHPHEFVDTENDQLLDENDQCELAGTTYTDKDYLECVFTLIESHGYKSRAVDGVLLGNNPC